MPSFLFFFLLSFNPLIHPAKATALASGCGLQIPTEVIAGGPSYNFTDFLSKSTSPSSYRAYRLTVPEDYDINTPAPLILAFHGRTESNLDQLQRSKLSNSFFNTKAIVAYPQGIDVFSPLVPSHPRPPTLTPPSAPMARRPRRPLFYKRYRLRLGTPDVPGIPLLRRPGSGLCHG